MKKITILIPAYNEAQNLPILLPELNNLTVNPSQLPDGSELKARAETFGFNGADFEWEFFFVNDGSRDNTLEILKKLRQVDPRVHYLNLSRNFGKENAMLAGLDFASGDAVIIMDADLQDPVYLVPEMVYWWRQGYDDVYGKRTTRGRESWLRKKLSLTFYKVLQHSTRIEVLPNVGDFRLLDRRVIDALKNLRETQRYTKGLFCWVGYNKKEVLFKREDRAQGNSSFRMSSLMNLAIEGITSFTTAPLRFSTILGFCVSILALAFMIYILIKTIIYGDPVQGFPTLMCVILFMGGVQLVAIGIIGEYVGRIFNEAKGRPVYIAESLNDQKL